MMEHNILASSKLYLSLTLNGLGSLLSLTPTGAETMVRRMIVQGRLKAEIDQVEGILTFLESSQQGPTAGGLGDVSGGAGGEAGEGAASGGEGLGGLGGAGGDLPVRLGEGDGLIRRWDSHIARTASSLEDVCVRIGALSSPAPAAAN
jgi:COP9 signalosome complex subunit 4